VYPARSEYTAPSTLEEVIATLAERGDDAKVLASRPVSGLRLGGEAVTRAFLGSTYTWTVVFFLWMWLGALALDAQVLTSLLVARVASVGIFVLIRARGAGAAASPR
jgi:hypothetical protein